MKRRYLVASPLVWGLSLAACSSPGEEAGRVDSPAAPNTSASSEKQSNVADARSANAPASASAVAGKAPIDVGQELAERAVGGDHLVHKVLYSWTTAAQLAELQAGGPLLSRAVSATRGPAAFDDLIGSEAERGRDVAKLLFSEGFAKKRFAWPNAFATVTGEGDGAYGDVLLRIELKSDAWILDYASATIIAADGSTPPFAEAVAHPERIAAVFFMGNGYREFVLVNESMIARWSAGEAPDVKAALQREIDFLVAASDAMDVDKAQKPGIPSSTEALLERTLAFNRKLSATELRDRANVLEKMRAIPHAALSKEPNATFVRGKARAPLAPICKVVKRDTHPAPQYGSYVGPRTNVVTPVCAAQSPTAVCITNAGPKASDAFCVPQPAFGR